MASAFEMTNLSATTPLLYDSILEQSDSSICHPSEPLMKSSVRIESALSVDEVKETSMTETKYVLRNGILLWSDLDVEDEWGNPLYHVDTSGVFYIDMKFEDIRTGRTSITLKQRKYCLPSFDIFFGQDETRYASIAMNWSWFGMNATVKFDNGEPELVIRASCTGRRYTFHRGDVLVASTKRKWCKHEYTVAAGENTMFFHALVAAVDKILTASRRKAINP